MKIQPALLLCCILFLFLQTTLNAQEEPLVLGSDRVSIIGDSITEQKMYSKFMDTYLRVCTGYNELQVIQLGWSGERADGFAARLENDLLPWKPTVATLCYGMNDGSYKIYDENIGNTYKANMIRILDQLKQANVKVVVGSPGAVDTKFFNRNGLSAEQYNANLNQLREIDRQLAEQYKMSFADVHGTMIDAMSKAKPALGENYDVCGKDGFHPGPNGQFLMMYAFLKAMKLSGEIGTINLDYNDASKASFSSGHKMLSYKDGKCEIESSKYPYCFSGDDKDSGGTRSIVPFTNFQQELNRFTLKVANLPTEKAEVSWGQEKKTFTKAELEAGVNLSEFYNNPFVGQFEKVMNLIGNKQSFETTLIKQMITNFRLFKKYQDEDLKSGFDSLQSALLKKHAQMEKEIQAELIPVKHTIIVKPVQ